MRVGDDAVVSCDGAVVSCDDAVVSCDVAVDCVGETMNHHWCDAMIVNADRMLVVTGLAYE